VIIQTGNPTDIDKLMGDTALIVAAEFGHTEVCRYLLGKGANTGAKGKVCGSIKNAGN
jgi:ankyrin repeat protein